MSSKNQSIQDLLQSGLFIKFIVAQAVLYKPLSFAKFGDFLFENYDIMTVYNGNFK
jgi:hypothetical protein